jgi:hypothetical protein
MLMAKVDEINVDISEVLDYTRLNGMFSTALTAVIRRKIAVAEAKKRGIVVSDEELQRNADNFRQVNNIRTVDATNEWLEGRGLTVEALEKYLEENIMIFELKRQLVGAYDREAYFSTVERRNDLMETAYSEFLAAAVE